MNKLLITGLILIATACAKQTSHFSSQEFIEAYEQGFHSWEECTDVCETDTECLECEYLFDRRTD